MDAAEISPDGTVVRVTAIGPPTPGPGAACSAEFSFDAHRDGRLLVAQVRQSNLRTGTCNLSEVICCSHDFTAVLDQPFEVVGVRSPARLSAVYLFQPLEPLVELSNIPNGWTLQSEGSEWNATGRWIRMYSDAPDRIAGTPGTLEMRQTFGGPEGSDPDYLEQVVVNGQPANLHDFRDTGEIQLDWQVGDDTVALLGSSKDFTAEELIAIAEATVTPD